TAFLDPRSAREFPLTLRAIRLFDGPQGTRARIEAEVPMANLLSLPGSAAGGRKASVIIGGKVVALKEGPAARADSLAAPWFGPVPPRPTLDFNRRADITLPPGPGPGAATRVVYTGEIDPPPGAYRIFAVAEDRQARSASAETLDIVSRRADAALGEIRLM